MLFTLLLRSIKLCANVRPSKSVWKYILVFFCAQQWNTSLPPYCFLTACNFWSLLTINKNRNVVICNTVQCPLSSSWVSLAGIKFQKISTHSLLAAPSLSSELGNWVRLWAIYVWLCYIHYSSKHQGQSLFSKQQSWLDLAFVKYGWLVSVSGRKFCKLLSAIEMGQRGNFKSKSATVL